MNFLLENKLLVKLQFDQITIWSNEPFPKQFSVKWPIGIGQMFKRDCNPGALFQNWDYGARTGIHSSIKNHLIFVEKCTEHIFFRTKNMR
jgi:hypothetical protein